MGLPNIRYEDGTEISPQIDLRKELVLFAGVRPVRVMTEAHSPLKIPQGKSYRLCSHQRKYGRTFFYSR